MSSLSPSISVCTLRMSTNGGSTTASTSPSCFSLSVKASCWTSLMASRWFRFIFQLPAMSGRRPLTSAIASALQRRDARQGLALEELEGGATTGGDVTEAVVRDAQRAHGRGRVAAADDAEAVDLGDRLGDAPGARRERRQLEHAHRAVPEDGLRAVEGGREGRHR